MLQERGASVRAHDPAAMDNAARRLPATVLCADPFIAAQAADAVAFCTPWPEYGNLDLRRMAGLMRGDLILDGRNMLSEEAVASAGLRYEGIGRGGRQSVSAPIRYTAVNRST